MRNIYSLNDLYPFSSQTATTTGETIPEDIERQHYHDQTVERSDGKTELVDFKSILIAIVGLIGAVVLLNMME